MRRLAGFALAGMVALWLISLLPASASTIALALAIGVGGGGGRFSRDSTEILALAVGAFIGAAAGGWTRELGADGPGATGVVTGAATIAITVFIAGLVASFVTAARRPAPPRR